MRITPVTNKTFNFKINNQNKKINHTKLDSFQKTNNISFNGLLKLRLKMQGLSLESEAKRNLKKADKISNEAKKIQEEGENILLKAQVYQMLAPQVLEEEISAINAARGFESKINFTDLEEGILSKTSRPLSDGGVHISVVRTDGTSRQIFVRNGKIFINECNERREVKSLYIFDSYTHELKTFAKNFKGVPGFSVYDEKYDFENGAVATYGEGSNEKNDGTYQKTLRRFEFKDDELIEYAQNVENIVGIKGEAGRVFSFSDKQVYEYFEDVNKEFYSDKTSSKKSFIFEPNGNLSFCVIGNKDIDDEWTNFEKMFEYENKEIQTIDLKIKDDNKEKVSRKTFGFVDGKLAYCNLSQKTSSESGATYERQILF